MKYIAVCIVCVAALSMIAFFGWVQADNEVVDHGYECFNLEIAQAQLTQARIDRNWRAVRKARLSVKNWEKFCK